MRHDHIKRELLMTPEEGLEWHKFKAGLGPIYPGYGSFDIYMNWMKEKLKACGCVDFFEHHWTHNTYRVRDWPERRPGTMKLVIDGREIPVGTFVQLAPATGPDGLTAPMVYYDPALGEPEDGEYELASARLESEIIPAAGRLYAESISEAAKKVAAMLKGRSII